MKNEYINIKISSNTYILNKLNNNIIKTNDTGKYILELLELGYSKGEILEFFINNYSINNNDYNKIKTDIDNFINTLNSNKTIDNIQLREINDFYFKNNKPYKLFIELTYNCNLQCSHCYRKEDINNNRNAKYISLENVKNSILDFIDMGGIELYITGGEAMLYPNIYELLEFVSDKSLKVTLLTNGTYLNKNIINKLKNYRLYDIRFSIYGDEKNHDSFTGCLNSYSKTIESISLSNNILGIGTGVFVVNTYNYNDINFIKKLFEDNNWNLSIVSTITPTAKGDLSTIKYQINDVVYEDLVSMYKSDISGSRCTAGISRFRITPDGDVVGCELLPITFGNINKNTFKEILCSNLRMFYVELYKNFLGNSECCNCKRKSICNICPAISFHEEKSIFKKPKRICKQTIIKEKILNNSLYSLKGKYETRYNRTNKSKF